MYIAEYINITQCMYIISQYRISCQLCIGPYRCELTEAQWLSLSLLCESLLLGERQITDRILKRYMCRLF